MTKLRGKQHGLCASNLLVAVVVPWKSPLLVRPEALEQWKWITFVKPQRVPDVISIAGLSHVAEYTFVWISEYIGVLILRFVNLSSPHLLTYLIDYGGAPIAWKPKNDDLGMSKRMEQANRERPLWFIVRRREHVNHMPANSFDIVE